MNQALADALRQLDCLADVRTRRHREQTVFRVLGNRKPADERLQRLHA